ncbi:MAG: thiamine biosynthesis protein ThiF [Actinomycetota bacterium]|nr:thiamine biosynthesis protein ThiF [Actinomycetota bacterium]MDQ2958448.1 thiamine biosynthesis protein ThiF [Actinomycetota bacterium]
MTSHQPADRGSAPVLPSPGRPPRTARLNASAVVLWRAPGMLQLELGARRVVIDNVRPEQMSTLLARGDGGTRPAGSTRAGLSDPSTVALANALTTAGFVTTRAPHELHGQPDGPLPAQLGPELGALTGRHGDGAAAMLARRRSAAVAVHGTSRITVSIATTLASAGVGWVQLVHGGEVSAGDVCPGGLEPSDEGARFGIAGVQTIRRYAPDADTTPIPRSRFTDLVILTDPLPVEPSVRASLHLDGLAHLSATVDGSRAVIGPLVVPGVSSCLRCADLHRCERDPCWPSLAVQLSSRLRQRSGSDVALCVAAAGLAAGQALAYLDQQGPETLNATLEWQLPEWRLRRRSWLPHHDCDCGASTRTEKHGRMGS